MRSIPTAPVLLCWTFLALACNGQTPPATEATTTVTEVPYDHVRCGLLDRDGSLWFGTTGGGLFHYDGEHFTNLTTRDGLINDTVYALLQDRAGHIWVGTINGASRYDGRSFRNIALPTNTAVDLPIGPPDPAAMTRMVGCMLEDRDGYIWFGTNGGGAYRYDPAAGTADMTNFIRRTGLFDVVQWMLQDSTGTIWFCSWDNGGVARYDGRDFTHYTVQDGLGDNMVFRATLDRVGNLWFALRDAGVARYNGHGFERTSTKEGLCSNSITSVVQARDGRYWFTSARNGVCVSDGRTYTALTTADGLCHHAVWFGLEDRDGRMWFGTRKSGLCRWDGNGFTDLSTQLAEAWRR